MVFLCHYASTGREKENWVDEGEAESVNIGTSADYLALGLTGLLL